MASGGTGAAFEGGVVLFAGGTDWAMVRAICKRGPAVLPLQGLLLIYPHAS